MPSCVTRPPGWRSSAPTCDLSGSTPRWRSCSAARWRISPAGRWPRSGRRSTPPGRRPRCSRCSTQGRPAMETFAPGAAGGSAQPGQRIFHWFGVHRPRRHPVRGRADRDRGHRRAGHRGGAAAQRGAVPRPRPGRRADHLGDLARGGDARGLGRVALDHRADGGRVPRQRVAGVHPPRGPRAGRAGLAGVAAHRPALRRAIPDADQERRVPALRRARRCRSSGTGRSPSGSAPAPT